MQAIKTTIKKIALDLGFTACGIANARELEGERRHLLNYLDNGYHGEMTYLARETEKRLNPALLMDNARSLICLALYYQPPPHWVPESPRRIARYALGLDYHVTIKATLELLTQSVMQLHGKFNYRVFCDTSPLLEKTWAVKSGLGWIGKNSLLIIPGKGSWFLLGEILTDLELEADQEYTGNHCGNCTRCLKACPTQALGPARVLNASKCLSYQTIEQKNELPPGTNLHGTIYGCDICQEICPFNNALPPVAANCLHAGPALSLISPENWLKMTEEDFQTKFRHSSLLRVGLKRLQRNLQLNINND